jgi:uncharacterized protein (DUF433 family)
LHAGGVAPVHRDLQRMPPACASARLSTIALQARRDIVPVLRCTQPLGNVDIFKDIVYDITKTMTGVISMGRYPLSLPAQLKREAEAWAAAQGVSLNQFIMWAVAEKVGELRRDLDDPAFPLVTYRRGAAGTPTPVIRGTGVRVQTVVIAAEQWEMTSAQIAGEYELAEPQVSEALAFYEAHREEIDQAIQAEVVLERADA